MRGYLRLVRNPSIRIDWTKGYVESGLERGREFTIDDDARIAGSRHKRLVVTARLGRDQIFRRWGKMINADGGRPVA